MRHVPFTLLPLLLVACTDQEPVAPDMSPVFATTGAVSKAPISGTIDFVSVGAPVRILTTPGGICHLWGVPVVGYYSGTLDGAVTFVEKQNLRCEGGHLVASGPFEGEITWNGRSGTISGQWTTNCKPDASQPIGISCDGTMNARGSEGLEGVRFHTKWGPGWWPFSYTGTAFWR